MAEDHLREGMITDTVPQELNIKEGAKLVMDKFRGRNIRLAPMAQAISHMLGYFQECSGGNTSGAHTPEEARNCTRGWDGIKVHWAHALKHKDFPQGTTEYSLPTQVPSLDDLKLQINLPLLTVAFDLYHLAKLLVDGLNASKMGGFIPVDSQEAIKKMIASIDDHMLTHIGTGEKISGGDEADPQFDLGSHRAPNYGLLGQIRPGVGAGEAMHLEPSKDVVPGSTGDAPDREVPKR